LLLAVGVLLVVWTIGAQLIYPLIRQLRYVLTSAELSGRRARGVALLGGALLAIGGAMHWVSVPSWTRADGFIRLPDHSLVRAGADGFIVQTLRVSGESVSSDELLFELDDPVLRARVEKLEWRQRELEVRRVRALSKDLVEAAVLKEHLADLKVEMQQAYTQLEKLFVASPSSGVFSLSRAQDLPGRFVRKGDLLGYVVDPSAALARVVVPQTRVDLVRRQTRRVELRLASRPEETFIVTIHREVPSATAELPSRILGTQGGGEISVDVRDAKGVRTIEPVFQFDLALPIRAHRGFVGDRVFVRFEHQKEPLTHQLSRLVRQLLLARLEF
jgi:putative peptide zinc metalloprotease protein